MDIVRKIEINASPETVYQAITTAAGIHGWWAHNSAIALEVGMEHIMYFLKQGQVITMNFRVDEMGEKKVSWTCTANGNPAWVDTQIGFELEAANGATHLKFSHANWKKEFDGTPLYTSVPPTWEAFMASLKSYCETGTGQPW